MASFFRKNINGASKTSNLGYSPRIVKKHGPSQCADAIHAPTHSSPVQETLFANSHRREAFERGTLSLRRWLAEVLLYHLLKLSERQRPFGSSLVETQTLKALSDKISHFLWYFHNGIETLDQTAFVAIFYVLYLVPKGILGHQALFTAEGVLLATRLFMISFSLAVKCFNDNHSHTLYKQCHCRVAKLTESSATSLELSALHALGFNIFLQHGKWVRHLETILEWTAASSTGMHISVKNHITQLLEEAKSTMKNDPQQPSTPPLPHCISKVRGQLLSMSGLDVEETY